MSRPGFLEASRGNRGDSIARRPEGPATANLKAQGLGSLRSAATIDIGRIAPDPNQPRTEFDPAALQQLADSLRARGQLQPIRVRWSDDASRYVVVVGERRWRAAGLAGLPSLQCIVVQGDPSAEDLLEDQLVENALRQDLKPVEQARSYRALMDARGYTLRDLAARLSIDFTSICKAVSLLDLPAEVQAEVDGGRLAATTAQIISRGVADPAGQIQLAARTVAEGLSREQVKQVVREVAAHVEAEDQPTEEPRVAPKRRHAPRDDAQAKRAGVEIVVDGFTVSISSARMLNAASTVEALRAAIVAVEERAASGVRWSSTIKAAGRKPRKVSPEPAADVA